MLRSHVLSFLLPSFVARVELPMSVLLDAGECFERLESVFNEVLGKYAGKSGSASLRDNPDGGSLNDGWPVMRNEWGLDVGGFGVELEDNRQVPVLHFCSQCKVMVAQHEMHSCA